MHWSRTSLAAVAIAWGVSGSGGSCQTLAPSQEQRHFSAEDMGVKIPSKIPGEVMSILRTDERVKHIAEDENVSLERVPTKWFSASKIGLGSEATDLIVEAVGPLRGANVTAFWVFIKRDQKFSLALMLPTHDLTVKNTRSRGYKDIESMAATAREVTTVEFKFDGEVYKEFDSRTEEIK